MPLGRRFQPGQSGNPGGNPRGAVAEARSIAKDYMRRLGWDRLFALAEGDEPRAAVSALKEICNRAYGSPEQSVEMTHTYRVTIVDIGPDGQRVQHEVERAGVAVSPVH